MFFQPIIVAYWDPESQCGSSGGASGRSNPGARLRLGGEISSETVKNKKDQDEYDSTLSRNLTLRYSNDITISIHDHPCLCFIFLPMFFASKLQVCVWVPPTWLVWLRSTPRCLRRNGPPVSVWHPAPWTARRRFRVCWLGNPQKNGI